MHHVHTRTVTSNVTTKEPVASLSPAVLFPFYQTHAASTAASPITSTQSVGSTTATSTTADSSCACHAVESLPAFAIGPSSFITLQSANSHQPLVLPLPQPPPPPLVSSSPTSAHSTHTPEQPLMVFSHGSTQVDTAVPSIRRLQRTLYSWSQLSDYTPKHCWELPAASSNTSQSMEAGGEQGANNVSISNSVGRMCPDEQLMACPGHPWVNFTYHMQVRQWQEELDGDTAEVPVAAADSEQPTEAQCSPVSDDRTRVVGANSYNVRLASPSGALLHRRRQSRQPERPSSGGSDSARQTLHAGEHQYHANFDGSIDGRNVRD